jgi:hypothetical protein
MLLAASVRPKAVVVRDAGRPAVRVCFLRSSGH